MSSRTAVTRNFPSMDLKPAMDPKPANNRAVIDGSEPPVTPQHEPFFLLNRPGAGWGWRTVGILCKPPVASPEPAMMIKILAQAPVRRRSASAQERTRRGARTVGRQLLQVLGGCQECWQKRGQTRGFEPTDSRKAPRGGKKRGKIPIWMKTLSSDVTEHTVTPVDTHLSVAPRQRHLMLVCFFGGWNRNVSF